MATISSSEMEATHESEPAKPPPFAAPALLPASGMNVAPIFFFFLEANESDPGVDSADSSDDLVGLEARGHPPVQLGLGLGLELELGLGLGC